MHKVGKLHLSFSVDKLMFSRLLEISFPMMKTVKESSPRMQKVVQNYYQQAAEERADRVSLELDGMKRLTSLQLQNVPMSDDVVTSISNMAKLKALVISFHTESSGFLDSVQDDYGSIVTEDFDDLPPIESLRLDFPDLKTIFLPVYLDKSLQQLIIERCNPKDEYPMEVILEQTHFPRLRSFTLTGPPVPSARVRNFISSHRKTLREVNIHWQSSSTALGDLHQIMLMLRGLAGDLEDFEVELEERGVRFHEEEPKWARYIVTGFGCVFRDREGREKRDLVELGLLLPAVLWIEDGSVPDINVDFRPEEFRRMFEENMFQTLERLCLMLPPQKTPKTTVENYMVSHL